MTLVLKVLDHKFYERRLRELARFSKVTWFKCPMGECKSRYKSTLGLAYHLDTCGKTPEVALRRYLNRKICLILSDRMFVIAGN